MVRNRLLSPLRFQGGRRPGYQTDKISLSSGIGLCEDLLQVGLDRIHADAEPIGGLLRRVAVRDMLEHVAFGGGQAIQQAKAQAC